MVKGLRNGEFTLVTGASGSGKTTFLSQLSIDFCRQGVPTLWGSFEIKNEILAHTMLSQYSLQKFSQQKEQLALKYLEDFEHLPLHFMNFYGSTSMEDVFQTLEYAVRQHDIRLICIDNMQFMLSD
jgi:twinkle protein